MKHRFTDVVGRNLGFPSTSVLSITPRPPPPESAAPEAVACLLQPSFSLTHGASVATKGDHLIWALWGLEAMKVSPSVCVRNFRQ